MKKLSTIIAGVACLGLFLSSCAPETTLQKDIKYMGIHFKPLTRSDLSLVGNLQAEITITGTGAGPKKALDKSFASNLKKGLINKTEGTEILYFAPGPGEAMTGSLYENEIFNSVFSSANQAKGKVGIFAKLFPGLHQLIKKPVSSDVGMEFAYYALVAKYPDVDYFINVRFDRKTTYKGKSFSETVIVKADGVKLKTD